jgi:signal transduction histidine kinase
MVVADEGSGIPHHVRHRLFTPFVTTKQSTGTGLGLWVTRGMIEKHGGTVSFRSRTETPSGTIFRVYLPQNAAAPVFAAQSGGVLQ